MSYILSDVNGYVGDLATINGLDYLHQFAERKKKKNITEFIDTGAALVTQMLLNEIDSLKSRNSTLRDLIQNLQYLMSQCEIVAIISFQ